MDCLRCLSFFLFQCFLQVIYFFLETLDAFVLLGVFLLPFGFTSSQYVLLVLAHLQLANDLCRGELIICCVRCRVQVGLIQLLRRVEGLFESHFLSLDFRRFNLNLRGGTDRWLGE